MSIELQYKWDKEEFLKASYANFRRRARSVASRALGVMVIILAASALLFVFQRGYDPTYLIMLFLVFYWFLLRWPLQRLILARQFAKHSERDADIRWTVNEAGFKGGRLESYGEFSWDAITSIEKTKEGFLVYRYPIFHWLPISGFKSPGDINGFESMAMQKCKRYVAT